MTTETGRLRSPKAQPTPKDRFVALLRPLIEQCRRLDVARGDAAQALQRALPFRGGLVQRVRMAAVAAIDTDWLLTKAANGIRFGRPAKDVNGFSVDAVLMDCAGPRHRHPNGEIDLCFALDGSPRFDGHPEGWVVYGPDTTHVPTVQHGRMLILYFLPGGSIEFLKA